MRPDGRSSSKAQTTTVECDASWFALGDSFTAGTGDAPEHGGWIRRAARALGQDGVIDDLHNVAQPGVRIEAVLADQVPLLHGHHAIVSVIAGANDVLALRFVLPDVVAQMSELLLTACRHGRLVLTSTCPDFFAHRFGPDSRLSRRVEQVNELVGREADAAGDQIVVIDTRRFLRDPALWHDDGVHPNPTGHELLAAAAVAQIRDRSRS